MKRTIIKKEKPKTKDLLTSYRGKKLKTFQKVYKNTTVSEKKTFLGFLLNDNSKNREGFINYLLATEKLPLKEQIILILKSKNYLLLQSFINPQTFQSTDLLFSLLRYQFDQDLLQKSVFFLLKNHNFDLNHQYDYWPATNFQTHSTKLNLLTLAFIKNQEKVFDYLLFLQANPFDQDCSTFKYIKHVS